MTLIARKYTTERTRVEHLRVKQSQFSESAKERLRIINPKPAKRGGKKKSCPK